MLPLQRPSLCADLDDVPELSLLLLLLKMLPPEHQSHSKHSAKRAGCCIADVATMTRKPNTLVGSIRQTKVYNGAATDSFLLRHTVCYAERVIPHARAGYA